MVVGSLVLVVFWIGGSFFLSVVEEKLGKWCTIHLVALCVVRRNNFVKEKVLRGCLL